MRLNEVLKHKKPHLYLDMDGVQADFFGAWADIHNVPSYKHIHDPETAIQELAHSSEQEVYDFFRNLPPLRGGLRIINWLNKHNIDYTVLSAPLRGPYGEASVRAKKDWLDEFNPGTSHKAIFTSAKHKYATNGSDPNVLVDDYHKYLNAFSDSGGISIRHDDGTTDHTIQQLEKIYHTV